MMYHGMELNGYHAIEILVDGARLLVAVGSDQVEIVAEPIIRQPGIEYRPDPEAVARASAVTAPVKPRRKIQFDRGCAKPAESVSWKGCSHSLDVATAACPYCEIEKLKAVVDKVGGEKSTAIAYGQGYAAGRGRAVYLKNKLTRLENVLRDIANDRYPTPGLAGLAASDALAREQKNRRGGLCVDCADAGQEQAPTG